MAGMQRTAQWGRSNEAGVSEVWQGRETGMVGRRQ